MPFTPYHFGPCAAIALPLRHRVDLPAFLLSNIVIDLEPLGIMLFNLNLPLHGFVHSFLVSTVAGGLWGALAWRWRGFFGKAMAAARLSYEPTPRRTALSALAGSWFHVITDAPLYLDLRPFLPANGNPFFGSVAEPTMYALCAVAFVPAFVIYFAVRRKGGAA